MLDIQERIRKVDNLLDNLNEDGLRQLAKELLVYPESRGYIEQAIEEFNKFYSYPLKEN